jgi:hypothetical protein
MSRQTRNFLIAGLAVSLLMGGVISYWASSNPDGLERVAADKGFLHKATENDTQKGLAVIPDYEVPGVKHDFLKVSLAGIIGTVLCFGLALLVGWLVKRRGKERTAS